MKALEGEKCILLSELVTKCSDFTGQCDKVIDKPKQLLKPPLHVHTWDNKCINSSHQAVLAAFEATMFLTTLFAKAFVHDSLLHHLAHRRRKEI